MLLETARFGRVECSPREIVVFPTGLIGFQHLHTWLLFDEEPLVWLQAVEDTQIALPLVSPFRYVPEYCLRLATADYSDLNLTAGEQAIALAVVGHEKSQWTLNLRAPVILWPKH